MKLILSLVLCLVGTALTAPASKQKRDILPGDSRYGTDYHHHHHHQDHENEVQVTKSVGGYAGSYSGLSNSYGPPNYKPGTPIGSQEQQSTNNAYLAPVVEEKKPTTSYVPPVQQPLQRPTNAYLSPVVKESQPNVQVTSYGSPVESQESEQTPAPEIQAPVVQAQTYQTSVVQNQVDQLPTVQAQTFQTAPVQTQTFEAPVVQPQTYEAPAVQTQTYQAPAVQTQTYHTPAVQTQSYQAPAVQTQTYQAPAVQTQTYHAPAVETQTYQIPAVQTQTYHSAPAFQSYQVPTVQAQTYQVPSVQTQTYQIPTVHTQTYQAPVVQTHQTYQAPVAQEQTYQTTVEANRAVIPGTSYGVPFQSYRVPATQVIHTHQVIKGADAAPAVYDETHQTQADQTPSLPSFPSFPSFPAIGDFFTQNRPQFPSLPDFSNFNPSQTLQDAFQNFVQNVQGNAGSSNALKVQHYQVQNPQGPLKVHLAPSSVTQETRADSVVVDNIENQGPVTYEAQPSKNKEPTQLIGDNGGYVY